MLSWEDFCRYTPGRFGSPFYGCVDKDGKWFDSSERYEMAVHWCACMWDYELANASGFDHVEFMETIGKERGYSIVHSDTLRVMYEAGLIN